MVETGDEDDSLLVKEDADGRERWEGINVDSPTSGNGSTSMTAASPMRIRPYSKLLISDAIEGKILLKRTAFFSNATNRQGWTP